MTVTQPCLRVRADADFASTIEINHSSLSSFFSGPFSEKPDQAQDCANDTPRCLITEVSYLEAVGCAHLKKGLRACQVELSILHCGSGRTIVDS